MSTRSASISQSDLEEVAAGAVRSAGPDDAVDGVVPRWVIRPQSIETAAAVIGVAGTAGLTIAPRGAGTALGWGYPPTSVDIVLDTGGLNRIVEHAPGDLVVTAEAGVRLRDLQAHVRGAGQILALDPPFDEATLGGLVATNASGPLRLRYGTARDLLIGITVILSDGTVARSGGKVVKNVAGYDLGKLFTGSFGTLGLIAQVIFRLHPIPPMRRTVVLPVTAPDDVGQITDSIQRSSLVPSALEVEWQGGSGSLALLLEGTDRGVTAQLEEAMEILRPVGTPDVADDEIWTRLESVPWDKGDVGLHVSTVRSEVPRLLSVLDRAGPDLRIRARGRAGGGVVQVAVQGEDDAVSDLISTLRETVQGSVVVVQAPRSLKDAVDVWGPIGDGLPLMRAVKARFDGAGAFNPNQFVGRI